MYKTCPKCGHTRTETDPTPTNQCPACGLYFDKWLKNRYRTAVPSRNAPSTPMRRPFVARVKPWLFDAGKPPTRAEWFGQGLLFLFLFVWGWQFIFMDHRTLVGALPPINHSLMHGVDLVFHEAGHVIFSLFGRFIAVLGGTLGQLLIPAMLVGAFLHQRHPFGASVGLWWLGQSLMDVAPYIYDARRGEMLLLGGHTGRSSPDMHDWHYLLGRLGRLEADHSLAAMVDGTGVLAMGLAFVWGAFMLWRYRPI